MVIYLSANQAHRTTYVQCFNRDRASASLFRDPEGEESGRVAIDVARREDVAANLLAERPQGAAEVEAKCGRRLGQIENPHLEDPAGQSSSSSFIFALAMISCWTLAGTTS